MERRTAGVGRAALALAGALLAGSAQAVDGVIEINQARAEAGGVTPGDDAGFPVTLSEPGSYRLTGDLRTAGVSAVWIEADDVTLDLNGFSMVGNGGVLVDGIFVSGRRNVELRGGTLRGWTRHGILAPASAHFVRLVGMRFLANAFSGAELQGQGNLVDRCFAQGNGLGIRVLDTSLVIDTVARENTGLGLVLGATSGYRSCVLTANNGGNGNPQVGGPGLQLGSNVCGSDLVCP